MYVIGNGDITNLSELKSNKHIFILTLVFLIISVSTVMWLYFENSPQGADESRHLISSINYFHTLTTDFNIQNLINVDNYYPPFYHFSTIITYSLFGISEDSAIYINLLYFGILLFSTYGIGRLLYNERVGFLSALFVSLFPVIIGMTRFYLIEIALISTVTLSIYLLLHSDHFKDRKYSILFGVSFAVSLLTKWTAIFFILPPLLIILYESYKSKTYLCQYCKKPIPKKEEFCSKHHKQLFKREKHQKTNFSPTVNLSISLFITFILSAIWYIPHFKEVYDTIVWGNQYWGTTEGDPEILTFQSLTYYMGVMNWEVSFIFMIIFLASVIYMLRTKPNYLLLSWIVVPYIVMTLMRNKNDRYTIASISAIALIGALWLSSISNKKIKTIITTSVVGIMILQLVTLGMGISVPLKIGNVDLYHQGVYGTRPPISENWKIHESIDIITKDIPTNPRFKQPRYANVGILPDLVLINQFTFQYYSDMDKSPLRMISIPWFESFPPFQENIGKFDYIIVKTGENAGQSRQKLVDEIYKFFYQQVPQYYVPISNQTLPDNSELIVYKNVIS